MNTLGRSGVIAFLFVTLSACGGSSTGGGSGGGGGALGGSGGGGASGGTGGDDIPLAEIQEICAKVDQLPCKLEHCVADATESAASAAKDGCSPEFKAILDCIKLHPMVCVDNQPELDPACVGASDAYGECSAGDCSGSASSSGGCEASCTGSYGVSCVPTDTPDPALSCTCTSGPNTGSGFTVVGTCNDTEWLNAAPSYCGP